LYHSFALLSKYSEVLHPMIYWNNSGASEFTLDFSVARVAKCLVFCVLFCTSLFVLFPFSFGHCIVSLSSIYGFWLLVPLYFANQIVNCSEWNFEDLLRFAEIESHTILSIKLIMDLLRFAEIEPHAIISIKLIMDLLRFASSISLCIIDPLHKNFLQSHEIYTC
jgi:hypothetical protein